MGWLFMNRHHMGGHDTPKSYLDAQFTFTNAPNNSRAGDEGCSLNCGRHGSGRSWRLPAV